MDEKEKIDVDGLLRLMLQPPFATMNIGARCLYLICVAKSAGDGGLEMSARAAEKYGISKSSFLVYMKELKQFGFIRLKERGGDGQTPNKYTVVLDWCISGLPARKKKENQTMNGKKYIDADALELAYRRMKDAEGLGEHSGGYVYNRLFETLLQAPEAFPPRWPEWIRTAERKPTAEDANEDGCVLSININHGDMNTTSWPWNMVADFPDNLPVWMPLPKKPYLK